MRLAPIRIPRASRLVAEELRDRILYGDWRDETRLPPEPELAEKLGISRHHLREGLRLLEQDGLVEAKRGHTGGIFITVPRPEVLARTMEGIIARTRVTVVDVLEGANHVHLACCRLAATNASDEDLQEITAFAENLGDDGNDLAELGGEFRELIARASRNETLILLTLALSPLVRHFYETVEPHVFTGWERRIQATAKAIVARDPARVQEVLDRSIPYAIDRLRRAGVDSETQTVVQSMLVAASALREGSQAGSRPR